MANGIFTTKQQAQGVRQKLWTTTVAPSFVDALVVAGGGGSPGGTNAGGGGAGGFVNSIVPVITGSALTVTVGAGGTAGANGSNSVFRTTGASGGGTSNAIGGSGGGTSPANWPYGPSVQGLFGQGNPGGPAQLNASGGSEDSAGGGGGAGSTGSMGKADVRGGGGGYGAGSRITGTTTVYSGGGGGSMQNSGYTIGNGGVGGGGTGASGTANTGGGAGTAYGSSTNGGSGIVVISYPDTFAAATSTTGSPTVSTSGSGSMLLNGTTQTLTFASNAVFGMGTGDFTVELWINTSDVSGDIVGVTGGFGLALAANTMYWQSLKDTTNLYSLSGSAITNGAWHHIAVCRSGISNRIFYDGVAQGSSPYTDITNYGVSGNLVIGNGSVGYIAANISNLRIVKGTALYTSNFTPSTTPLTAVSGTSLLLSTVSGGYLNDNSTNGFSPNSTTATAPTWNASSPFSGTGYKNRVYTWTSSGSITF
jgi:hypothetical protein